MITPICASGEEVSVGSRHTAFVSLFDQTSVPYARSWLLRSDTAVEGSSIWAQSSVVNTAPSGTESVDTSPELLAVACM